jgi:uncharacterized protein (DUF2164 family)
MPEKKDQFGLLSKENRASAIKEIIAYFGTERDEEIGVIAAEDILDFFLETIGKDIFNKGIDDSKKIIAQNAENLDIDLDLLRIK